MKARKTQNTDFIVRFEGVQLPKTATEDIARAIQAAALDEFIKLDLATEMVPQVPRIRQWAGIHLRSKGMALDAKLDLPNLQVIIRP